MPTLEKKIVQTLFLLLFFFTPLIFNSAGSEVYEFPKLYFVFFLGGLITFIFLLFNILIERKYAFKLSALLQTYVLAFILSTVFSLHLYTSIWGYYSRFNDGLLSLLSYIGLSAVINYYFSREKVIDFFKVSLLTLIPISIFALFQITEVARVYSTFGQPNWLAQYIVFLLPFCLYLALFDTKYFIWFPISILGFCALWFSYSMSGLLGFLVSLGFFVSLNIKGLLSAKVYFIRFALLLFLYGIIAVFNLGVFKLRVQDAYNDLISGTVPHVYAQADIIAKSATQRNVSDAGFIRLNVWKASLELPLTSVKNLLIGTGPETYPYAFQPHRPKDMNYSSEWNFVVNKPHNYYIEVLIEQGLVGLLLLLAIYFLVYVKLPLELKPGFVAFLVTNIFGWPTVATSLLFWVSTVFISNRKEEPSAALSVKTV